MAESFEDRLRAYFREQRPESLVSAYLFGSHAEGRAHRESDVDVGVLLDRASYPDAEDRFRLRVRLGSELIGLLHWNEVDVVVLNDAPPLLGRSIVNEGRRVYCQDAERDKDFRREVQLRAADLALHRADAQDQARDAPPMTLVERLLELRLHLEHLRNIRPGISGPEDLEPDSLVAQRCPTFPPDGVSGRDRHRR